MKFHQTLRAISCVVLASFTSLTLQPVSAALQITRAKAASTPQPESADEKYSRKLDDLKEQTQRAKSKRKEGKPAKDEVKTMRGHKKDLEALETDIDASFDTQEQLLMARNLPQAILDRHTRAKADFKARQREFKNVLKNLEDADDKDDDNERDGSLDTIDGFFKKYQQGKTHTPVDPNKLPFRVADDKVRPPATDDKSFALVAGKTLATGTAKALPAAPTPADLAETEDVQITQPIKDLAVSLNNNPVKIYNWVRNNIEFLPTYGSIQGSDMTLQAKRGNAIDTASLLIALYRAAGIPSRYAYGTIEVPVDQAMNWVGGVTKADAAISLLGQGGIPNIAVVAGGTIKSIKMEHVWVEAYVDYYPSRGAVNRSPDTWVPMDASFKQYTYTQGMDIKTNVPLDANALITQAKTGATINETEGWVQNVNQAAIQTTFANYRDQIKAYIDTTKLKATVGDVLGSKTIVAQNYAILPGTLPYKTVLIGAKLAALPDSQRHKFVYNLYASSLDRALDSPILSLTDTLPKLAGKKITLSFAPASQADADLIASYLPKPHADGSPILPSELPKSLPGYLIKLTAEFRVAGQVVATGGNFTMGQELISSMGLFDPAKGWEYGGDNIPIAGEYVATVVDGAGVPASQLQALKDKLASTKNKLEARQFAGLTKEDLSGDLLYSAVLSYFSTMHSASQVAARANGMIEYRKPSFGNFFAAAQPAYWYGIARQVSFPGLVMDIDRYVTMVSAKDNSTDGRGSYLRKSGQMLSAYEHLVPEKLFTDAQHPGEAVSAVKALAVTNAQGQKIFRITGQNINTILPQLQISQDVKTEIQNAIAAGKEATVSQSNVTISGWTGVGYIIEDLTTGAGAYKISGGANGGAMQTVLGSVAVVAALAILALGGPLFIFALFFIFGMALLIIQIENLATDKAVDAAGTFFGILALAVIFLPLTPVLIVIGVVLAIIGVILSILGQVLSRANHFLPRVYA